MDSRPVSGLARSLFYLVTAVNMHCEASLGLLRWSVDVQGWPWPWHAAQLSSGALGSSVIQSRRPVLAAMTSSRRVSNLVV